MKFVDPIDPYSNVWKSVASANKDTGSVAIDEIEGILDHEAALREERELNIEPLETIPEVSFEGTVSSEDEVELSLSCVNVS